LAQNGDVADDPEPVWIAAKLAEAQVLGLHVQAERQLCPRSSG
jgi:hypothetical protein